MAEQDRGSWLFPYREDPQQTRLGQPILRPFVQVGFIEDWHSYSFVFLGSVGFLDRWTVTASRFAQAIAVEER